MKKSLSKKERLKKSSDFRRVLCSTQKASCFGAKLAALSNSFDKTRLGVGLSKKFGNAVQRNRAKRQIREIFRLHKEQLKAGFDLVFLVYPGEVSFEERTRQFISLIEKLNLKVQFDK